MCKKNCNYFSIVRHDYLIFPSRSNPYKFHSLPANKKIKRIKNNPQKMRKSKVNYP